MAIIIRAVIISSSSIIILAPLRVNRKNGRVNYCPKVPYPLSQDTVVALRCEMLFSQPKIQLISGVSIQYDGRLPVFLVVCLHIIVTWRVYLRVMCNIWKIELG